MSISYLAREAACRGALDATVGIMIDAQNGKLSPTMLRTRVAILNAAVAVFASHPSASMLEVAHAAQVSRSTLHRHFSDRPDLIAALAIHVRDLSNDAFAQARPAEGPPEHALRRMVEAQFDLGPILSFFTVAPELLNNPELVEAYVSGEDALDDLLERLTPHSSLSITWRRRVFWELLRLGATQALEGEPRHECIECVVSTLLKGIGP